jgi:MafB19-like deaminase
VAGADLPSGSPSLPAKEGNSPWQDPANIRARGQIPQRGEANWNKFTRARLDVGNKSFYGKNAPGVQYERPPSVNSQAMRHAEGEVFGKAALAGIKGGDANLYVDQAPCGFCSVSLGGLARSIGLNSLRVWTPEGLYGTYDSVIGRFLLGGP